MAPSSKSAGVGKYPGVTAGARKAKRGLWGWQRGDYQRASDLKGEMKMEVGRGQYRRKGNV